MNHFRAWRLPRGFIPAEQEVATLREPASRPLEHPVLGEERIRELMTVLRRARDEGLVGLPVARVVKSVDRVARRLLDCGDPLRRAALGELGPQAGLSDAMAETILDRMAFDWTEERLLRLLESEFPDPLVLDGFRPASVGGALRALGFPLTFHLGAGTVPGVSVTSLVRALLVKSSVLLKPGRGDVVLPVTFARGLEEEDPVLSESVAVLYWPGAEGAQGEAALRGADLVVVYGGDDTVRWARQRLPPATPLRAYRHRLGVGLLGCAALEAGEAGVSAEAAARAVAMFDQRGCVSPHVLFVEEEGETDPLWWAALLARALQDLEASLPSGPLPPEQGAALQQLRGWAEMEEGAGRGVVRHGGGEAPWTVVFQPLGELEPSCLARTVRVIPVGDLREAVAAMEGWRPYLQTVGVAGLGEREEELAESLARLGVSRMAPLDAVPWPPPWWHHDGEGPLRALVRWTDVEPEG
jgi:hypothetical protein